MRIRHEDGHMTNNQLSADRNIVAQFITAITNDWPRAPETGPFEIRCLGEHRKPVIQRFSLGKLNDDTNAISLTDESIYPLIISGALKAVRNRARTVIPPHSLRKIVSEDITLNTAE